MNNNMVKYKRIVEQETIPRSLLGERSMCVSILYLKFLITIIRPVFQIMLTPSRASLQRRRMA